MKKTLAGIIGLALLGALAYWAYLALAPEEKRIRWLLDDMASAFNRCRAGTVVGGLAEDFEEKTAGIHRNDVHQSLVYIFFNERDPQTKEFRFRVELDEPRISLLPPEENGARRAEVRVSATLLERRGKAFESVWKIALEAELEKSREGWKVLLSRHTQSAGKRPF